MIIVPAESSSSFNFLADNLQPSVWSSEEMNDLWAFPTFKQSQDAVRRLIDALSSRVTWNLLPPLGANRRWLRRLLADLTGDFKATLWLPFGDCLALAIRGCPPLSRRETWPQMAKCGCLNRPEGLEPDASDQFNSLNNLYSQEITHGNGILCLPLFPFASSPSLVRYYYLNDTFDSDSDVLKKFRRINLCGFWAKPTGWSNEVTRSKSLARLIRSRWFWIPYWLKW
jgi:hypothetical protein